MHWLLIKHLPIIKQRLVQGRRGGVAVLFALSALTLILAVGAGIDLQRVYTARQQLSAVATMTCQYSNRPTVALLAFGAGGSTAYAAAVNSYYAAAMADQNVSWTPTTSSSPFSYTYLGAGNVTLTASVPTTIVKIIGITSMPVGASMQCFSVLAGAPQQPAPDGSAPLLVNEGFENSSSSSHVRWYLPTGAISPYESGQTIPLVTTAPTNAGYVGSHGNEWIIMGYCVEVDVAGENLRTVPEGTHSAELDCDNGSGSAGNSSISTEAYMAAGSYELRWWYASRIPNTYYQTSYVCGTTTADASWANDASYVDNSNNTYGSRTNQINVYLDQNSTGSPPVHTTLDGTETLAGSNLIDECVYSWVPPWSSSLSGWVERSVLITVTTPALYWLSFAADGANDSYGGQIDDIRLCVGTCAGTVNDNFPPSWLAVNNSGSNVVLFEDTFESPTYSGTNYNTNGDVGLSTGSSSYWGEAGQSWSNAPTNQLPYWTAGCPQGNQCVQLGWNTNSLIARPFLLVPGYYQISYEYVSEVVFGGSTQVAYCGATPADAQLPTANTSAGNLRVGGNAMGTLVHDTNAVGVFMANAQVASTPIPSTTLGSTTSYNNPDGTTSTTPTVPPNSISLSNYTVSTTSPLLDICGYATAAQTRTASVLILKPAFYWLTLAALGTSDAFGGQIDDVKITALGSPYMSGAPSSSVTIPVPDPQPGSTLSFTGFSITTGAEY